MRLQETNLFVVTTKTEGMYLAVFDALSPANTPGKWDEAWNLSGSQSVSEPYLRLFFFNDFWADYATSHHLLAWTLIFDGVYRTEIVVSPNEINNSEQEPQSFIGAKDTLAQLWCPSGELVVTSLYELGVPITTSIKVLPGLYEVLLSVNEEQESKHQFLENISDYPDQDGPDYTLYFRRISSQQTGF